MIKPLRMIGARIYNHAFEPLEIGELNTTDRVIAAPHPNALSVDLEGYTIFPGLINAHDHLDRNHYPRTKYRERYDNAHQWGEDVSAHLDESPFKELRAYPLADKCLIGGLKNLLCGALTVAHHDPPHAPLFKPDFPVRVVKNYGWAHSLHFDTPEQIVDSFRRTPKDTPWFIHLAEGTDEIAQNEYWRLREWGCIGKNVVLIHAVGLTDEQVASADEIYGISHEDGFIKAVWCPSSNVYLLGETMRPRLRYLYCRAVLGTDSRLTGIGDLLDELRFAVECDTDIYSLGTASNYALTRVYGSARIILFQSNGGNLNPGAHADFIVTRPSESPVTQFCQSHRADLALIVRGGVPQIGDPDMMAKFPHVETVEATLNGAPKLINKQLARQIQRCSLKEPGLEIIGSVKSSRWF